MRLNQNLFSLSIYNSYKTNVSQGNNAMKKISSGLKINSAKDNPDKIKHNEVLKISIVSTNAASKNLQDMSSMMQSVDGDMQQMNNILTRIKELVVKGNNDALSDLDKQTLQNEINVMKEELDYIAKNSDFNGIKLLNKDNAIIKGSTGPNESEEINIPTFDLTLDAMFPNGLDITVSRDSAQKALTYIDDAITLVSDTRATYGALQKRMEETQEGLDSINGSLEKAQSVIGDADIAEEMMKYTTNQTLAQAAISLMTQSNQLPQDALQILRNVR